MPVSKLPSSAVAECGVGPELLQVTVSPAFTVTDAGENWKSLIVTVVEAAATAFCFFPGFALGVFSGSAAATGCAGGAGAAGAGAGSAGAAGVGAGGAGSTGAGAAGAGAGSVAGSVAGGASGGAGSAPCAGGAGGTGSSVADSGPATASAATIAYITVSRARRITGASAYLYAAGLQKVRAKRRVFRCRCRTRAGAIPRSPP